MHTPETRSLRLTLEVTLGADRFKVDGEISMAEATVTMKEWGALRGDQPAELAQIKKLTEDIDDETTKDEAALGTSTVPAKV